MENTEVKQEAEAHITHKHKKSFSDKNYIPLAIVLAGLLVAGALYFSNKKNVADTPKEKTVAENLGINPEKFKACYDEKRFDAKVKANIESAKKATAHIPPEQGVGTPYSIAVAKNGTKVEIAGAYPVDAVKGILDSVLAGKAKNQPEIDLDPVTENDHYFGSKDAEVVIVEYSDLECPYCSRYHQTMHQVITDYKGKVAWVYRHLPLEGLHPNAYNKALASECAFEQIGNDGFWKYIDQIFQANQPKKPVFDPLTGKTVQE